MPELFKHRPKSHFIPYGPRPRQYIHIFAKITLPGPTVARKPGAQTFRKKRR